MLDNTKIVIFGRASVSHSKKRCELPAEHSGVQDIVSVNCVIDVTETYLMLVVELIYLVVESKSTREYHVTL
jgi:acyl CoA:acetate/3-ketoacid CoA transferase beta subunit